jgi:hypothetical protein
MTSEIVDAQDAAENNKAPNSRMTTGDWEIHSWGDHKLPGMAVASAIATLQLGATLAETPEDTLAMHQAAEYLTHALAPQLKAFRQALAAR